MQPPPPSPSLLKSQELENQLLVLLMFGVDLYLNISFQPLSNTQTLNFLQTSVQPQSQTPSIHQKSFKKILETEFGVMARTENSALLEKKKEYYENCPGCKIDRLNEEQIGVPYRNLSYIWTVSLCTGASIHAPSFVYMQHVIVLLFPCLLVQFFISPSLCSMLLVNQLFSSNFCPQFSRFNLQSIWVLL